ncbi:MAG: NAD(P)-dependent oxidoreductase [Bacteroidota bacterium]
MKNIAFLGLGIMGSRMAANLQKAGFQLTVYNRSAEATTALIEQGAQLASNPAEAVLGADIVVTMLSTPEVVKTLAQGENGFLSAMQQDSLWINSSTINPSVAEELGTLSKKHGVRYIDAPVAGSKAPAENGELLFLAGGDKTDIDDAGTLLDAMGKKTLHLGKVGKGSSMKMLINQLLAQSLAAFSEALVMGEAMGLSQDVLFNVLTATPVVAPVVGAVRPKLENGNYEANFPLKWIHKDLHLSTISAYEKEVATPVLNTTKELFAQAKKSGLGDLDFTAIYQFLKDQ